MRKIICLAPLLALMLASLALPALAQEEQKAIADLDRYGSRPIDLGGYGIKPIHEISARSHIKLLYSAAIQVKPLLNITGRTPVMPIYSASPYFRVKPLFELAGYSQPRPLYEIDNRSRRKIELSGSSLAPLLGGAAQASQKISENRLRDTS